ncbi:DoxX family protein [soil metagenome]
MKKPNIYYWIFTGLFAALMLFSAIPDIMVVPAAVEMVSTKLGYPKYLIAFLGVAKLLGAIAILIPGFPRIKEWAYAGLAFDLTGATYSSISIGDPVGEWIFMVLPFSLLALSYIFYHKKLSATPAQHAATRTLEFNAT